MQCSMKSICGIALAALMHALEAPARVLLLLLLLLLLATMPVRLCDVTCGNNECQCKRWRDDSTMIQDTKLTSLLPNENLLFPNPPPVIPLNRSFFSSRFFCSAMSLLCWSIFLLVAYWRCPIELIGVSQKLEGAVFQYFQIVGTAHSLEHARCLGYFLEGSSRVLFLGSSVSSRPPFIDAWSGRGHGVRTLFTTLDEPHQLSIEGQSLGVAAAICVDEFIY